MEEIDVSIPRPSGRMVLTYGPKLILAILNFNCGVMWVIKFFTRQFSNISKIKKRDRCFFEAVSNEV